MRIVFPVPDATGAAAHLLGATVALCGAGDVSGAARQQLVQLLFALPTAASAKQLDALVQRCTVQVGWGPGVDPDAGFAPLRPEER